MKRIAKIRLIEQIIRSILLISLAIYFATKGELDLFIMLIVILLLWLRIFFVRMEDITKE